MCPGEHDSLYCIIFSKCRLMFWFLFFVLYGYKVSVNAIADDFNVMMACSGAKVDLFSHGCV